MTAIRLAPTRLIRLLFLALLSALLVSPRAKSQVPIDSVDAIVQAHMQREHIPGVSIAVVHQNQVIVSKGFGLANVELKSPATPQSVFSIGSVSKQLIATGILLLVQDGKLNLDQEIRHFYPKAPQTWQGITLRHLLSHTSGLIRESPAFDATEEQPDSLLIEAAFPLPLVFPTGTKWQYCNVGYFALADIIRKVSGQPWAEFINQRVFQPAGMTTTRTTSLNAIIPNRVDGYVWRKDHIQRALAYRALRPSGAFVSTVLDLAKWDAVLNTDQILTAASRQQMWTPIVLKDGKSHPYGMGWEIDTWQGAKRVRHGGSLPGFRAEYARFPQTGLSIIVLTNGDDARPGSIAQEIAALYLRELNGKPVKGRK